MKAVAAWWNDWIELTLPRPRVLTTGHHMTALGRGHGSEYGGISNGFIGFPANLPPNRYRFDGREPQWLIPARSVEGLPATTNRVGSFGCWQSRAN